MTVYHVDKYYGKENAIRFDYMPYSLKGTIIAFFGIPRYPRWSAFPDFIKWISMMRVSEKRAKKLAEKLNKNAEKSSCKIGGV